MQVCVFCQGFVEPATHECQECGRAQSATPASTESDAAETLTKRCQHCGELLPPHARFCRRA